MSAHVLLNLLNKLGESAKMQGLDNLSRRDFQMLFLQVL